MNKKIAAVNHLLTPDQITNWVIENRDHTAITDLGMRKILKESIEKLLPPTSINRLKNKCFICGQFISNFDMKHGYFYTDMTQEETRVVHLKCI
jgi:hypothetical protein